MVCSAATLAIGLLAVAVEGATAAVEEGNVPWQTANCSASCTSTGRSRAEVCNRVCEAVEVIAHEPCGESLLGVSIERFDLLSYSSGHVADALAILIDRTKKGNADAEEFASHWHLVDVGSPQGCAAIEDAHYCLAGGEAILMGLCLPHSCDSDAVARLVGNITATGFFPNANNNSRGEPSDDSDDDDGSLHFEVICGDEGVIAVDAGAIAVFTLVGILAAITLVGTAFEYRRRAREDERIKPDTDSNSSNSADITSQHGSDRERPGIDHGKRGGDIEFSWKTVDEAAEGKAPDGHAADSKGDPTNRSHKVNELNQDGGPSEECVGESLAFRDEDADRRRLLAPATSGPPSPVVAAKDAPAADGRHEGVTVNRWQECLECFSLVKNVENLLAPPRAGNEFGALDGVRALSICWIALGHTFEAMVTTGVGITNQFDVLPVQGHGLLARLSAQVLVGSFFAVDSFFLMSGFLLSSTLLKKLESEEPTRRRVWQAKIYLHRYLRLTPTLAFVTLMWWKVLPLIGRGQGPLWCFFAGMVERSCGESWWAEVTYLSNYLGGCVDGTWYLANDMQLFLAGVPLVALYHCRPRKAVKVVVAIVLMSCGVTLLLAFLGNLRFSMFASRPLADIIYVTPFTRCPVYLIGLLGGFAWDTYFRKQRVGGEVDRCETGIEEKYVLLRHRAAIPAATVASALLLALPVFGTYWAYQDMNEFPVPAWLDHLYVAFSRPAWALGLSLMCLLCFCGHGGLVNWLLTRPLFATLSRLSYCVYFTHLFLLPWLYWSRETPSKFTSLDASFAYMGMLLGSVAVAAVLHLLVEAPFRNLEAWARRRGGRTGGL